MPRAMASPAPIDPAVRARCVPISPGARASSSEPPTSGRKPMPTSGMPMDDRSVTIRVLACAEMPTPPPSTMPSMMATTGLGYSAICRSSRYSSRQNVGARRCHRPGASWNNETMSPPAHSPRSPAPVNSTVSTASSSRHCSSAAASRPTISWVSALMARGRLSTRWPNRPLRRTRTVGSVSCGSSGRRRGPADDQRMISLVPSRIRCTRRSRTIFSRPYSPGSRSRRAAAAPCWRRRSRRR